MKLSILFLALSIPFGVIIKAEDNPVEKTTTEAQVEQSKKSYPYPLLIGGGLVGAFAAWQTVKAAVRFCLRRPVVYFAAGSLIAEPVLKRTLFAEHPEKDLKKLSTEVLQELQTNFTRAKVNLKYLAGEAKVQYDNAAKLLEKNYPDTYNQIKLVLDNEHIQTGIKTAQEQLKSLGEQKKD